MTTLTAGREMPPDAFAVVMASGIISIDAQDQQFANLQATMSILAVATFGFLVLEVAVRTVTASGPPLRRIRRPDTALRLFSFVAASTVLGARFHTDPVVLWALAAVAGVSWLILVPLAAADVGARGFADLREHAHGAWLLIGVATASSSITAADLGTIHPWVGWLVLSIVVWLLAALFYVVVVGLIATRVVARLVAPGDVTPDSWILMGTVATLTLAVARGDTTLKNQDAFIGLASAMDPIIATLWIFATLWIPVLLAAELWHFDRSDNVLGRTRTWWSAVFPLAMYSAATQATASQLHRSPLHVVALTFFWVALGMFVIVSLGWLHGRAQPNRTRV